ncbi:MAG: S-adenosylmethionine hydrolase [Cyclobacteriaceae bacterium]|jgi:S-adenosylmethionine hydrolase
MARSQNSFMKKQKAEKKRKAQAEKLQRRIEKKNSETSGALDDMIAYVDEFGNILDEKPEEPKEVKKELKEEKKKE